MRRFLPPAWSRFLVHGPSLPLLAALTLGGCAVFGRSPQPAPPGPGGGDEEEESDYEGALPDDAVSDTGLFVTHLGEDGELFFEIPESALGREMLLMVGAAARPGEPREDGNGRMIEWRRRGDEMVLWLRNQDLIADTTDAIWDAVAGTQRGRVVAVFDVEADAPSGAALVEVTDLFTSTHDELGSLEQVDDDATWVERVTAFPENVELDVTQTGDDDDDTTYLLHWSILELPDEPMMPRLADDRVGYISSDYIDYSAKRHGSEEVEYIHRHRLVKEDPNAEVSDPVEPIVYWIDSATPDWLKPWVVQGVNDWRPAFEAAGFSDAIEGRIAPTPAEDPDFSLDDARHSVIYWLPSTVENANGGQVVDPRSGEIIRGRVQMYHNVMSLVQSWYFTQVGPLDPRAHELPLPDSLMGRLVEYVVAHEVGHAIGLPHNMKASAMYPPDSIRDVGFLRRMGGHVATLMDYSRFNYVAQPEDSIPVELLVPGIGPYDRYAVHWGYAPIPGAGTPEEERSTLDAWARQQDTIPWFRFTTSGAPNDPEALTEAVGDADAVQSSTLGLRNLERVAGMLLEAGERPGEDYELLEDLYDNLIAQWGRYHGHVAAIVGGAYSQEKYGTGPRFEPVERARQREAVEFLSQYALHVPDWVVDPDVLRRIEAEGEVERIRTQQMRVVNILLNEDRLDRLVEYEALASDPAQAYTLADLTQDLRTGLWSELLGGGAVNVDVYRRNLQRGFLDVVDTKLYPPPEADGPGGGPGPPQGSDGRVLSDVRPVLRGELRWIRDRLDNAIPRSANTMTRLHLQDLREEVERILSAEPRR